MSTNYPGQGHKGTFTFGREAAYGGGGNQVWKLPFLSLDLKPNKIEVEDKSIFGEPSELDSYLGGYSGGGTLKVGGYFEGLLELVRAVHGATGTGYVASTVESGVRDHTCKWADQLPSYSFDASEGDVPAGKVVRADGVKFLGYDFDIDLMAGGQGVLTLPFVAQNLLSDQTQRTVSVTGCSTTSTVATVTRAAGDWNADIRPGMSITGTNIPAGTTVTSITSATVIVISNPASGTGSALTMTLSPNFPTRFPVMGRMSNQTVLNDGTSDAVGSVRLRSLNVSYQNPHKSDRFYGVMNPDEPLRSGPITAKIKVVQEFLTKTAFDLHKAHTAGTPKFQFQDAATIGAASKRELEFSARRAYANDVGKPVEGMDTIIQTTQWTCKRDATDVAPMVARIRNTEIALF